MNHDFIEMYYENRNNTLENILSDKRQWYDFIKFWARNLGYHTADNLISIYSYNPTGSLFATFEEWNNSKVERKVKAKSRGIPILKDGYKNYVFDISQTWGKSFTTWNYHERYNEDIVSIYDEKFHLKWNENGVTTETKLSFLLQENINRYIEDNYLSLTKEEYGFVTLSIFSILNEKLHNDSFLYSELALEKTNHLDFDTILKCLQIINKETCQQYKEVFNYVKKTDYIKKKIAEIPYDHISNIDLQKTLETIEADTSIGYEIIARQYNRVRPQKVYQDSSEETENIMASTDKDNDIEENINNVEDVFSNANISNESNNEFETNKYDFYDLESAYEYLKKLDSNDEQLNDLINAIADELDYDDNEHYNISIDLLNKVVIYLDNQRSSVPMREQDEKKKSNVTTHKKTVKTSDVEQLSLFEPKEKVLANKICNIFNSFNTKYKDTFFIDSIELEKWEHISSNKRNLSIILKSDINVDYAGDNSFICFNSNEMEEQKLLSEIRNNYFLNELMKDSDFDISFSPSMLHIFWHNFDTKNLDLEIDPYKKIQSDKTDVMNSYNLDIHDTKKHNITVQYERNNYNIIKKQTYKEIVDDISNDPREVVRIILTDNNEEKIIYDDYNNYINRQSKFYSLSNIKDCIARLEDYQNCRSNRWKDVDLFLDELSKYREGTTIDQTEIDNYIFKTAEILENGNYYSFLDTLERYNVKEDKIEKVQLQNYHIPDRIDTSFGAKARYKDNIKAIQLLKQIEGEQRNASFEEQQIIAKYVGWGGISDVFDSKKSDWEKEYKELESLLTEDEYNQARQSVLSSFYTPNVVIDGIYKALMKMGVTSGNVLEPAMGIGNCCGRLPQELENSKLYGVELDSISGRIAKQLYPNSKIEIKGYQEFNVSDNFFDIVVGNVPFGNYQVVDKRYKNNALIHDYFIQKSLDKARAGGLIALITTDGTLDKKDMSVRKYIAERAEFVGAIRLPNNAFKQNANTTITSDIIFLKKRDEITHDIDTEEWLYTSEYNDNIFINNYFVSHPEMMLGKMELKSSQFGYSNTLSPIDTSLDELMEKAILSLPSNIFENVEYEIGDDSSLFPLLDAEDNIKNGAFEIRNINTKDIIYQRKNSKLIPYYIQDGVVAKRIIALTKLKGIVKKIFEIQMNDGTDEELSKQQEILSIEYDKFIKKFGYINDNANSRAFSDDPDYFLLTSLENKISIKEDEKPIYVKGDIFSKRTLRKNKDITTAENAEEALAYSMNFKGYVDLEYMQSLYGKSEDEIISELDNLIFQNPAEINTLNKGWEQKSEYLSGNVKQKLKVAEIENVDGKYDKNIQALKQIQPQDISYDEIGFKLGSTWIPEDVYHQYVCELLDIQGNAKNALKIKFSNEGNLWLFQASGLYGLGIKNTNTWGTDRADALSIIKCTLNLQSVTVYDTVEEKKVINPVATANAREKQELIRQDFKEWLWKDEERRDKLTKLYNDKFNCIVEREYDGSHLTFDGMNPAIQLRPHQLNAVARALYSKNVLFAHAVGAGKTFECIASSMELKRLGTVNKPMFIVPNNLLGQWATDFLKLYPMANILVANEKDFEKKNRKKFVSKIATGEYDAIIMAHSSFGLIPMSKEYEIRHIEEQIYEVTDAIDRILEESGDSLSVKKLEQKKINMQTKLTKLLDSDSKDDVITFEELGVDHLIVDEADLFKNLPMFSKMRNIAGVNNSESKKATDLFMKISYILENNNGKGAIFATGTPISNSMCELYIMQKYLQPDRLKEMGLEYFDSWASTFGEIVNSFEITPDGSGFRTKQRFSQFQNIPELMSVFREIADIKTADMLELPIPKLKDGKSTTIVAPASEELKEYVQKLAQRSESIHNGCNPRIDNMLLVTNDGRKAALDLRLIETDTSDIANSKVNLAVENIYRLWLEKKEDKLTQLVFCDLSTPKEGAFNIYDDIKSKLMQHGIPANEIEYIHNAKTNTQRLKLFDDMRSGNLRILLGSTSKMGAGMNVQDRLYALHHLDCPWRPRDIEQREGRILRQGNQNEEVEIYRYITEGSFDAYSYQLIESKSYFINQIMTNRSSARIAEDLDRDTLTFAEVKALASGNPLILDKFKVENELKNLYLSKTRYDKSHIELQQKFDRVLPRELKLKQELLNNVEIDMKQVEDLSADKFKMIIRNIPYSSRKEASTSLYKAFSLLKVKEEIKLGEISGFDIVGTLEELNYTPVVYIQGQGKYKVEVLNVDEIGNIYKLENLLKSFDTKKNTLVEQIKYTEKQLKDVMEELEKPFTNADRIRELQKEKARIDSELDIDKQQHEVDVVYNDLQEENLEKEEEMEH